MSKQKTVGEFDIVKYAEKVLDAVNRGATNEQALFFLSTFKRYTTQLKLLQKMENELVNADMLTKKEYVKGREVIQSHPLLSTYNSTVSAANATVKTLISIIKQLDSSSFSDTDDDFLSFLKDN